MTLSDFGENLAKVWQSPENSDLIARGERATLSDHCELSYTSLGLKLTEILFFPFPVFERYDTNSIFSIFSSSIWSAITLFIIQAFQNATFGVKNTALAQKSVKLQQFDDISIIVVQIDLHQT